MPSLLMLFRGCREEIQASSSVCEAPAHTRFVKLAQTPFPHPKTFQRPTNYMHTKITVLGYMKNTTETKIGYGNLVETTRIPELFMSLTWPKRLQQHPKFVAWFSHSLGNTKQQNFPPWACGNGTKTPSRDPNH